ncbi:MAG: InlB B-repeat-containing protein [Intestinibacillus sp.]
MRISHKFCILSVTAALMLSIGVQAAGIPDPEAGGVTATATTFAATTSSPPIHKLSVTANAIKLDGSAVNPAGYNINDENYFKLRDIAYLMNGKAAQFSVGWEAASSSITLTTEKAYQKVGGELSGVASKPTIRESNARVMVNGTAVAMTAYNIDGNNYFRLRDIGEKLGFTVDYDATNRVILIESPEQALSRYTVTFNMNGHGTQISPKQDVEEGSNISAPTAPTATGYAFSGWYKDSACETVWNFAKDTVTADVTLYAKWVKTYTVTFDMNGHGSQVSTKTGVTTGSKISAPTAPTADGYVFGGWYIESGCYTPWVFNTDTVAQNVTLYAMWTAKGDADDSENTGSGGSSGSADAQRIDGVMTVLLDSGHGGADPGVVGNGLQEKAVNLSVTQRLRDLLEAAGVHVVMTVNDLSTTLSGNDRISFVREKMAKYNFDLSVSIHHNGGGAVGAEVYVQTDAQDPTGASRDLGNLIIAEYLKLGQSSRGVKTQNLYMVRVPSEFGVPGILSEFSFLDNASDAAKIDSAEEQQAEAQALYNAILAYFDTHKY